MKELKMAEAKGLMKPVKLKKELAELLGATELPRTEITKKLWDYSFQEKEFGLNLLHASANLL